ncbi:MULTISPECIES: squalene/phytoene synthase family protein [unclassified Sphingomonas]|jgi:15-cis-phytoene synthase|uniref:squalene/phytoene synthase family protein n=1 Tax=unclassified Sphingomonas TaxID=196159 RepID=UPI000E100924|nr:MULTISPECIES: squalene/phytoene synthase family protein [unclassified Sphingomonas]AXJ96384.1 hypothetical protein DM480_13700 [Sphingomonas sp. FARSPH]
MTREDLGPDRHIALASAPAGARPALAGLFALDRRLGDIVRAARDPMIGQMRLTWWYEALGRLDAAPAPAEPILRALAADVLPNGIAGAALAAMIEGWEVLLDHAPDADALDAYAKGRGETLFSLGCRILGADMGPQQRFAGRGWALADLAMHSSNPAVAQNAAQHATAALDTAFVVPWPPAARPLGSLALLVRLDGAPGGPLGKTARLTRFRLFGR